MKKLNNEQSNWVYYNFQMNKTDFPKDFGEIKDFQDIICGRGCFRGKDYKGDSLDFCEDCFQAIYLNKENKIRFLKMFKVFKDLFSKAEKNEYYELLHNLYIIKERFEYLLNSIDNHFEFLGQESEEIVNFKMRGLSIIQ
jgi:hypothetical protein